MLFKRRDGSAPPWPAIPGHSTAALTAAMASNAAATCSCNKDMASTDAFLPRAAMDDGVRPPLGRYRYSSRPKWSTSELLGTGWGVGVVL